MHERKAVMAREADAFIALPGTCPETFHCSVKIELCIVMLESLAFFDGSKL